MEDNIIKLNYGGRYQIVGSQLFSLNYAERGMSGSTLGKVIPEHLANEILETYEKEEANRKSAKSREPRREIKVRAKPKAEKKKKYRRKQRKSKGSGVKLGNLLG